MRYNEVIEKYIENYCLERGIKIKNGMVPKESLIEINGVVSAKIKSDRIKNRIIEEIDNTKISLSEICLEKYQVESPIEDFMFNAIINACWKQHCRPQFEIGKKRVDFAFPIAHLAVECDGKEYHFTEESQIERDQKRDQYLAKKGWMVLHFDGLLIRRNITLCIDKIGKYLNPFLVTA